jgi:hypothetical protein
MRVPSRWLAPAALVLAALAFPLSAWAGHTQDPNRNLQPLGHIVEPAVLGGFGGANPDIHTDIAFWGEFAFQGNWDGFNIRDISSPLHPTTVSRTFCDGNQGDVVVWRDILVRTWNPPAGTPGPFGAGLTCDGHAVRPGFAGLHIFDISNLQDPQLVGSVALPCGSHTATGVPDLAHNRLLIYNSASSDACQGIEIVRIPLDDPGRASLLRTEPAGRECHDTGVILGDAMLAACAGGDGFTVWSLGGARGGSLVDPRMLYSRRVHTVVTGHSATFTWDGEVLVFGHEPGGGVQAACERQDPPEQKSAFFFDADNGRALGRWTLPRPQSSTENCTIHNYNVVPLTVRDILVSGNYQAGTWVTDFTHPGNAHALAFSDPPPAPVPPGTPFCCDVTGAWSSYWYNGLIYETNIGEGLNIFRFTGSQTAGALELSHLNPQTQEFTLP